MKTYAYGPYEEGADDGADDPSQNPYRYTGRELDAPGLYYYRARYYSTDLRRFISEDPLGLRALTDCEKNTLKPYIPQVDLDKADIHEGKMPWYAPSDMAGITRGNNIYFRDGAYPAGTAQGFGILAHELVHVGQYRNGMTAASYLWSVRSGYAEDSKYEAPAYALGRKVQEDVSKSGLGCGCGDGE